MAARGSNSRKQNKTLRRRIVIIIDLSGSLYTRPLQACNGERTSSLEPGFNLIYWRPRLLRMLVPSQPAAAPPCSHPTWLGRFINHLMYFSPFAPKFDHNMMLGSGLTESRFALGKSNIHFGTSFVRSTSATTLEAVLQYWWCLHQTLCTSNTRLIRVGYSLYVIPAGRCLLWSKSGAAHGWKTTYRYFPGRGTRQVPLVSVIPREHQKPLNSSKLASIATRLCTKISESTLDILQRASYYVNEP